MFGRTTLQVTCNLKPNKVTLGLMPTSRIRKGKDIPVTGRGSP
jgi:hypothetical protein